MPVLLPEKTLEIWTGIAVTRFLPFAEIWSPPNYGGSVDQWIRAGKTWAFELKAPYSSSSGPRIPIDLYQLHSHAFSPSHGVPVLYVLPAIPWSSVPVEPIPSVSGGWTTVHSWAWVVPAGLLARRFGLKSAAHPPSGLRHVNATEIPLPHPVPRYRRAGLWLGEFLLRVGSCTEAPNWTLRVDEDYSTEYGDPLQVDVADGSAFFTVHVPAAFLPAGLDRLRD